MTYHRYSDVIGLSVTHPDGSEISVKDLQHPIMLRIAVSSIPSDESESYHWSTSTIELMTIDYHCQFYDESKFVWSDGNVTTVVDGNGTVVCSTNHLTSFSVGSVLKSAPVANADAESKSTSIGVIVGPAVGGASLMIIVSLIVLFIVLR